MLFLVMVAALALAGITVSLIFRLGRIRARRAMRSHRRAMWDAAKTRRSPPATLRSSPPTFHREETRMRRAEAAHSPRPHDAREQRQVTDMLAQLARSAQP